MVWRIAVGRSDLASSSRALIAGREAGDFMLDVSVHCTWGWASEAHLWRFICRQQGMQLGLPLAHNHHTVAAVVGRHIFGTCASAFSRSHLGCMETSGRAKGGRAKRLPLASRWSQRCGTADGSAKRRVSSFRIGLYAHSGADVITASVASARLDECASRDCTSGLGSCMHAGKLACAVYRKLGRKL